MRPYLIFLCLLSALSTWVTYQWGDFYLVDSHEYWESSKLWMGSGVAEDPSEWTKRPPIYPVLLGVFGVVGTLILQNLLLIFTFYRVVKFLDIHRLSKWQLRWVYVATALSVNAFLYADKFMAETISMFLLWMAFESYASKRWLWLIIIVGFLPFVKPVFLFLPLALLPLLLWKRETRAWSLGLLACAGISMGYIKINEHRTGAAEFSSIQHINALHYNKYQFDVHRFGVDYAAEVNDSFKKKGADLSYPERVDLYNSAFIADVKSAPFEYVWFHLFGAVRGTIDPGRFDLQFLLPTTIEEGFAHREDGNLWNYLRSLHPVIWLVLLPLALFNGVRILLGIRGLWTNRANLNAWFAALIIAYVVAVTGPINASRFMVPLVPLLLWLSITGLNLRKNSQS